MAYPTEKIMARDYRGDGVEVEAEKVGALYLHRGLAGHFGLWCLTAPCGWALGWFKTRAIAVEVAEEIQAEFPGARWERGTLEEIFVTPLDRQRAWDIVRPRRAA
jgi:hypothetical protein